MVVQSNNDARQQQLYRKEDNTGDLILGAAAVGGLAYLLMKGRGAKGLAGEVKSSEAVGGAVAKGNQPAKLEEAVEAVNQTKAPDLKPAEYSNGQQYIVDNMLGQLGKETAAPVEDTVKNLKQKANLKNSVDTNVDTSTRKPEPKMIIETNDIEMPKVEAPVVKPEVKPLTRDDVKTVNINDVMNDNIQR